MGSEGRHFDLGLQIPGKCIFNTLFLLQRTSCPWLINTIFPCEYYGLVIKCMKSHHPNRCIKVGNKPPRLCCLWFIPFFFFFFFCNQTWLCQSAMLSSDFFYLCMSKHCSITVIYSQSNEFIFCTIHFSLAQTHEIPLLSLNKEIKQKLHVATSLPWFHWTSIFQGLYFYFVPNCFTIYFQCIVLFKQATIKQLDWILWNPVFI